MVAVAVVVWWCSGCRVVVVSRMEWCGGVVVSVVWLAPER